MTAKQIKPPSPWLWITFFAIQCNCLAAQSRNSLWDMRALSRPPAATWGERKDLLQEVFYEGEPLKGKPTRIFAYFAKPDGPGPFPGMVLVHGGGGMAFSEWALHWAKRGYAAISMDLSGRGPKGDLPHGGPDQSDTTKFRPFQDSEAREMWTYHAVAAAIRAHSLLAAQPGVDKNNIGLTGISWGGYLTCIIAGVDHGKTETGTLHKQALRGITPLLYCRLRFRPFCISQLPMWTGIS